MNNVAPQNDWSTQDWKVIFRRPLHLATLALIVLTALMFVSVAVADAGNGTSGGGGSSPAGPSVPTVEELCNSEYLKAQYKQDYLPRKDIYIARCVRAITDGYPGTKP